jgi:hypothetical protein
VPPATTEAEGDPELSAELERLGVHGELVLYGDGCSFHVLALPSLERPEREGACSPRGAVSPGGALVAVCPGDETRVHYTADGGLRNGVPGCSPAWMPNGILTVSYEREVVRFRRCRPFTDCPVALIPHAELERAARRHPTVPNVSVRLRVLVDGIAWLTNTRAAVLLSIRIAGRLDSLGPLSAIAFFEHGRLSETEPYFRAAGGTIAASPRGTYVTQTPDVILRSDGTQVSLPPHLGVVRSFAWSPDERFLALATRFAVVVVDVASLERHDATGGGLRTVTLPQPAVEVGWR